MAIVSQIKKTAADPKRGMTFEELMDVIIFAEQSGTRTIANVETTWRGKLKSITFTNEVYFPDPDYTPTTRRIIGKDPSSAD